MPTLVSTRVACAVCRRVASVGSPPAARFFGSADLDSRPPSPYRHAMADWLQECAACGYVNTQLGKLLPGAADIVRSPAFRTTGCAPGEPALVGRFRRYALLVAADPLKAGWAMLHGAWVCDDAGLLRLANLCREECDNRWLRVECQPGEAAAQLRAVSVDVLRRANHLDEADRLIDQVLASDGATPDLVRILRFQRRLIGDYDLRAYRHDQALAAIPAQPLAYVALAAAR